MLRNCAYPRLSCRCWLYTPVHWQFEFWVDPGIAGTWACRHDMAPRTACWRAARRVNL